MIKTKDLENIIKLHAINTQDLLIWGRPGVGNGKANEIKRVANTHWDRVIHMDGTRMSYESLEGFPVVTENGIANAPHPAIAKLEKLANQQVLVFIDEVSSLDNDNQRVLLNMIDKKETPNGVKLNDNVMFVLLANPTQNMAKLVEDAVTNRFATYNI